MLKEEDKIFKNLYNTHGWEIDKSIKRDVNKLIKQSWDHSVGLLSLAPCLRYMPTLKLRQSYSKRIAALS